MRRLYRLVWQAFGAALALSLCVVPLSARVPVPAVRPLYFEHLSTHDGLSQSTVMSMLQDSQGYLWLGTESGLDRYDGNSIREYRRERGNAQALASDYIWSIAEDAHGDLWLATDGGGVERWDRHSDRFEQFRHDPLHPETLASDAVRTLLIDSQGRIWAGTLNQGLDVLDPRTGVARHFRHREGDPRSLASDAVLALYADRAGQIWVGSSGGLSRYEPESDDFVSYPSLGAAAARGVSDLQVRAIHEDHAGIFWLGTVNGGLIRFEPTTGHSSVFHHKANDPGSLSQDRVWSILEDDGGRLWVATADGLNLMDRQAGTFAHYRSDPSNPQSLRDSDVLSLYQDRGGILWVGTRSGGASHWNPRSWQFGHYTSAAFRDTQVSSFADDGAGTLWVGTIGGGLIEIDIRSGRERHYGHLSSVGPHLSDDRVMALRYEPRGVFKGVLWVGTMSGGLDRIDLSTGAIRTFKHDADNPNSLPADGVMSLYEDRLGTLWVGTFGGGLASIERSSGRVTCYPYGAQDAQSLSNPRVSAIAEDGLGNLWIGTTGGGLDLLDRHSGQFYHYQRADRDPSSLSDDTVYALFVDAHGQVWVGTAGGGLDRVIGSSAEPAAVRFENQAGAGGLESQVIYGIEADREEHLWLSTNDGLARFDPTTRALSAYHEAQGLQGEEFNFNAHYQSADGVLYFGGNSGFNAFAPESLTLAAPAPRVVLTGAAKLNHALATQELPGADRPLQLAYDDKLVTLDFAALDFTSPASNRYAYKLDGFDAGWVDAGSQHRATYTNLDAGNYVFRVRAANADGVWSYVALTIPVHVAPAPWNTLAARLAYAAVFCCLLGYFWRQHRLRREHQRQARLELEGIVRSRTHELEERNQELQVLSRAKGDFVARMSHELRTPMNGVLGMTSLMLDTNLDSTQRRFAEAIHRSADSLLSIVDDVLDFSKIEAGRLQLDPTECDLTELAEQTMEMLAARAASKDLELLVDLPPGPLPHVRVDSVRLRQVLVNLGGNAVKFTEQGEVALRLVPLASTPAEFRMRLEVADTGPGIAPENQARIFEEFAQEDASTTRRFGGTGLGLAISRQIVELMGGELTVASAPGVGSIFSFELSMPVVEAVPPAPWSGLDGRRVLVVDDHAATRALLSQALMSWQAQPRIVASLEEALAQLQSSSFDVLLVDDRLLDGEAAERLRRELAGLRAGPWIIRLTGFGTVKSAAASALAIGTTELTKPMRLSQLHRLLSQHRDGVTIAASRPEPTRSGAGTAGRLRGRVLVVEDQPLNREVAVGMLSSLGLQVETAENGRQALDKLQVERYDAVLMDCEMPVMDGFEATRELRRREPVGTHLPVFALTADATGSGREACLAAGMDEFLSKPFRRETLRALLNTWLTKSVKSAPALAMASAGKPTEEPGPLLDGATLAALRALPRSGANNMLSHVTDMYLQDSPAQVSAIEQALERGDAAALARAAHAWRSCNGNIGAHGLAQLCRDVEESARQGDLQKAERAFGEVGPLYELVCEALQRELRRSA